MSKQVFTIKNEESYYRLPEVKRVVKMGRGEHKYETIEIYAGFDIETTNIYQIDGWAAYMYHAQLSLANGTDTYVYFFRKWDQVTRFFDLIVDHYGLGSDRRMVCWIANMSFEFQFMRRRFEWDQGEFDFFAKEERQPLKATYHGIEFREALSISGGSLEFLAKTYCKTQKLVGDLDYRIERNSKTILTDKEKAYCENDVVILAEFSEYMFTHYIRKYRKVPLTKTSIIIDQYKRNLRNMCKIRDEKNHLSPLTSISEYKDYLLRCFPDESTYDLWFKWLFRGGYVHANAAFADVEVLCNMRDITSHYPGRMDLGYCPVTPFKKVSFKPEYLQNKCCILHVQFDQIHAKTSHSIESKNKVVAEIGAKWDNGRLIRADYLEVYLTEMDYKVYEMFYNFDVPPTITECWIANRGKYPPYLLDVLNKAYKEKNELKSAGLQDSQQYAIKKSEVNTNYGATVKRLKRQQWLYTEDWELSEDIRAYQEEIAKQILLPQWGIWVTAAARFELLSMLHKLTMAGVVVVYMDTDSMKYIPSHKAEQIFEHYNNQIRRRLHNRKLRNKNFHDLGMFDIEMKDPETKKPLPVRFKTLGAKRYIYYDPIKEKVKATVAGMPKVAIKSLGSTPDEIFRAFNYYGYQLKPEISGKITTHYRDEPHEASIGRNARERDYMHEESSVALFDIPFTLTITDEYRAVIDEERMKRENAY